MDFAATIANAVFLSPILAGLVMLIQDRLRAKRPFARRCYGAVTICTSNRNEEGRQ